VQDPIKLKAALDLPIRWRIFLAEFNASVSLKEALHDITTDSIVLAVGPEGGWTEAEHQAFTNASWIAASLGSTILRSETAAIAALAVIAAERQ
jgi:16S rRNA (uracil1498-N3)-methyltransferase